MTDVLRCHLVKDLPDRYCREPLVFEYINQKKRKPPAAVMDTTVSMKNPGKRLEIKSFYRDPYKDNDKRSMLLRGKVFRVLRFVLFF